MGKGRLEGGAFRNQGNIKRIEYPRMSTDDEKRVHTMIKQLPAKDRTLYSKIYVGEEHPRYGKTSGLWLAKSLPGGELWIRSSPRKESDKITVFHEYGHYVWYFSVNDEQKRIFRKAYEKADKWAIKEAAKREGERVYYPYSTWRQYELAGRAGRNVKEAFAEGYAWYYASKERREILRNKRPEVFVALQKIEQERAGN